MMAYRSFQHRRKMLAARVEEGMYFLRRFVESPRQVGSVIPSSPFLTKAVMDKIEWDDARYIAELGAGTGVFTRAIVQKLRGDGEVFVFEIDPALSRIIKGKCKGLEIYGDARELPQILANRDVPQLDYVVSSLPFAVLPPRMTVSILDAVNACLRPGGKLVAYQYSKQMKHYLEKRFSSVKISFVLRNVPPAFVYECTK